VYKNVCTATNAKVQSIEYNNNETVLIIQSESMQSWLQMLWQCHTTSSNSSDWISVEKYEMSEGCERIISIYIDI